jgi:hypothetical protein
MGDRHVSVTIDAPPEVVFGLYTDAGRNRRHHPRLVRIAGGGRRDVVAGVHALR